MPNKWTLTGVVEENEGAEAEIKLDELGLPVLVAYNEDGNNSTILDLTDLLKWLSENPEATSATGFKVTKNGA